MLEVRNLTVKYGSKTAVENMSFSLSPGQWMMLAGPNGAGKSTALEAIAQTISYTGEILFCSENIRKMKPRERARKIGMLSQQNSSAYDFTVEEIVRLGRYAYGHENEEEMVERALELTGMTGLRQKNIQRISGGERQRTFLAQVFAQNPQILLLDEPANHLDLCYQRQIFSVIKKWLSEGERAVLSVVHDLSLAKKYGTHGLLMSEGRAVSGGTMEQVMTRENLQQVYGIDVFSWMQSLLAEWQD